MTAACPGVDSQEKHSERTGYHRAREGRLRRASQQGNTESAKSIFQNGLGEH
jgi:hypothetical protein